MRGGDCMGDFQKLTIDVFKHYSTLSIAVILFYATMVEKVFDPKPPKLLSGLVLGSLLISLSCMVLSIWDMLCAPSLNETDIHKLSRRSAIGACSLVFAVLTIGIAVVFF